MPASAVDNSGYIFYASLADTDGICKHLEIAKKPGAKTARCRFTVNEESSSLIIQTHDSKARC